MYRFAEGLRNVLLSISVILSVASVFTIDGFGLKGDARLLILVLVSWIMFKAVDSMLNAISTRQAVKAGTGHIRRSVNRRKYDSAA